MLQLPHLKPTSRYIRSRLSCIFISWHEPDSKTIAVLAGACSIKDTPLSYFAHYSYVSEGIGPRAELTEDFLGTGHGFSAELSGNVITAHNMEWFVRVDVVDSTTRLLSGIAISLDTK